MVYQRTVRPPYISMCAKRQKALRKGGVKVQWVWEGCTEEVVLDCFLNSFDRDGGNSMQGKCLSKDVM